MGPGDESSGLGEMITRYLLGAVALALAVGRPVSGETLTDAFVAAYQNSNLLEASRALLKTQDESVVTALAALRPTVNAVAAVESSLTRAPMPQSIRRITDGAVTGSLGLTVELLLTDGGNRKMAVKAARESVMATRQTLLDVEQAVLLNAAIAYHDVVRQTELLRLAESGLNVMETEREAAEGRFELGEITRTDVSLVEARLAVARNRALLGQGELEIARENYRLATGSYPGELAGLPPSPEIPATLEDARSIAMRIHPSIVQGKHLVAAAQLALERAKTANDPRLTLAGTVGGSREVGAWANGVDRLSVSLSAAMPLYAGGKAISVARQARANVDRTRSELQQAAQVASQQVAIAWTRLEIAASSIESHDQQVAAAELAYEGVKAEAEFGLRTTLDVLDSEQDLLSARNDRVAAIHERQIAVYRLLSTMGLMTVQHLGLGIPVYNPEEYLSSLESGSVDAGPASRIDGLFKSVDVE